MPGADPESPTSTESTPVVLEYNTTKTPWHQRAIVRKGSAIAFVVISLAALVLPYARDLWTHYTMLQAQRQMAYFNLPPTQIAYQETPGGSTGMTTLQREGFQLSTSPIGMNSTITSLGGIGVIARYNELRAQIFRMAPIMTESTVIFLHRRRAPVGPWRLVHVSLASQRSSMAIGIRPDLNQPILSAQIFQQATWSQDTWRMNTGGLYSANLAGLPSGSLTLLFGQIDPNDDARFTIQYQTPTGNGTIDGILLTDDSVQFTIRDGPAANSLAR